MGYIKMDDWNALCCRHFDWALRMINSEYAKKGNIRDSWVDAMLAFQELQRDVFDKYGVNYSSGGKYKRTCLKGVEMTPDQLFDVFHSHMDRYADYTRRQFLFSCWVDLRHYVNEDLKLNCAFEYFKPATAEEIAQARKDFGKVVDKWGDEEIEHTHTFKDDACVLEYRGVRFIVDAEWGDAWVKEGDGSVRSFPLEWDWWYPIDEYLDLGDQGPFTAKHSAL